MLWQTWRFYLLVFSIWSERELLVEDKAYFVREKGEILKKVTRHHIFELIDSERMIDSFKKKKKRYVSRTGGQ
jgi:hypothetical protein